MKFQVQSSQVWKLCEFITQQKSQGAQPPELSRFLVSKVFKACKDHISWILSFCPNSWHKNSSFW